jgi:hypothetical protein
VENLARARTAPPVSQAPNIPARIVPLPSARPRSSPQAILSAFQDAVARAENLRKMQNGREVGSIKACVLKLVNAERQKAVHILAAADHALAELQG